ncbi:MAG: hypothetical protein IPP26_13075 [Flavobacteriales bacterium]|nr:hypothetical protein [Flavobacteriales bacterium]
MGLALGAVAILYGCKKDKDEPNGGTLDRPLFLHVDSACVQLPNVFTPNGDGINDILVALGNNTDQVHVEVRTFSGDRSGREVGRGPAGMVVRMASYFPIVPTASRSTQPAFRATH